jgi:nitrous oxidase accessory protein
LISVALDPLSTVKASDAGNGYIESPQGTFFDLGKAILSAESGDVLHVYGGIYNSSITIAKPLTLIGHDWPTVDGGNEGTVVKVTAPDVLITGFKITNSGKNLDKENSGIAVEAPKVTIKHNLFEDTLFGIYLRNASNSIISHNTIHTKSLALPRRGDPIRIWFSNDVLIENNEVIKGRDVVLWYSERLTIRGNNVSEGRYGLHFMYCDDATIENNRLTNNSVGAFLMYSRRLNLHQNYISNNRGPSGFGIGLKDMDDATISNNVFIGNRIGASLDNSPRQIDSTVLFNGNAFSFNDIGIKFTPSVRKNQFTKNSFKDNIEQIHIAGNTKLLDNAWSVNGIGNYWSDYAGYDANGDGKGDIPYKSHKLFENVTANYPNLRLFLFSPAVQSINFASSALPMIRPKPKLIDKNPLMKIYAPPVVYDTSNPSSRDASIFTLGLFLSLGVSAYASTLVIPRLTNRQIALEDSSGAPLMVDRLSKRFGRDDVVKDLTFSIRQGESVAFWGPNGAGKSTLLHCILGIIPFEGEINIGTLSSRNDPKEFRGKIGFVPQEINLYVDLTVSETLDFFSSIRRIESSVGEKLLRNLNLSTHSHKKVGHLSGGMKQRLGLALALLSDPPILILDEPTTSLDSQSRTHFFTYLNELKTAGKTLIFASHRVEDVVSLADKIFLMEDGSIVKDCSKKEFSDLMIEDIT